MGQPMMFPAPIIRRTAMLSGTCESEALTPASSSRESCLKQLECATPGSWRQACEKNHTQLLAERAIVREVAGRGPDSGVIVDLHTGHHRTVTYWLRDDVRSLCVFDSEPSRLRVFSCVEIEQCSVIEQAAEVIARKFFLGLRPEDMQRGVLITMERSAHGRHVVQQGRVALLRVQVLLLCRTRDIRDTLVCAIRALMAEFLVHDRPPYSGDAFHQVSDPARVSLQGFPANEDNDDSSKAVR